MERRESGVNAPVAFCRLASQPAGVVVATACRDGAIALCADGSGRITGIPQAVWDSAHCHRNSAKCYRGDISRKRKLPDKQEGKKRMRKYGSLSIPQEAFIAALRMEEE